MLQASSWTVPARSSPTTSPRRGGLVVLVAGAVAFVTALALYLANLLGHPLQQILDLTDLRLYVAAGQVAQHAPAALYQWQFEPGMRFTYTPFAALLFTGAGHLPWAVLAWLMTGASVLALGLAPALVALAPGSHRPGTGMTCRASGGNATSAWAPGRSPRPASWRCSSSAVTAGGPARSMWASGTVGKIRTTRAVK